MDPLFLLFFLPTFRCWHCNFTKGFMNSISVFLLLKLRWYRSYVNSSCFSLILHRPSGKVQNQIVVIVIRRKLPFVITTGEGGWNKIFNFSNRFYMNHWCHSNFGQRSTWPHLTLQHLRKLRCGYKKRNKLHHRGKIQTFYIFWFHPEETNRKTKITALHREVSKNLKPWIFCGRK